ncbi:MAG: hypothetical protein Ct9H90mP16_16530 [Candidatus Poseidoniales archaeon]|nr:MAG: hypothetical protein Ct9H90mP16_16530 [Candidatus Poseidoniales archaeon]
MRIEQRIGRLDRFGQTADEILILNLAFEGTIDAAIFIDCTIEFVCLKMLWACWIHC